MRPRVSISTTFDYSVPIERQIRLVAEAGFSHLSLGGDAEHSGYLSEAGHGRLNTWLSEAGLEIDTIHGPRAGLADSLANLTAAAVAAADLGAPVVVTHPAPFEFEASELPRYLAAALDTCRALEPVARETGIVFAIENMLPGPADELVRRLLAQLDPRYFGFCYDSSHDQIDGTRQFALLDSLKDRLVAVHLSDRIREFVDHVSPGEGFIDWPALTRALRPASFTAPLLFEVMVMHSAEKDTVPFLGNAYWRACWVRELLYGAA
jgi:sugar phosphate isomerase/epimerase